MTGCIGLPALAQSQAQTLEYPIKAAFLFKFGEFVQWPAGAFAASNGVLNICVVGDSAFAGIVASAVQNETVAGRKVATLALASIAANDPCHIVYAAGSAKQSVSDALSAIAGRPMLTVTDSTRGPSAGIIHFVILNNRVRFAIDDNAAAANGLTLSSALLNIAVSVQRRN
jgi:hypothetical protein